MAALFQRLFARPLAPILFRIERARFRLQGSSLARQVARRRLLSLVLAAGVALTVHGALSGADSAKRSWGETVSVVMTRTAVEGGDALTESSMKMIEVPRALAPTTALTELPSGRRARTPLDRGEIVTAAKVAEPSAGPIASRLSPGTQAVTVPLGDSPAPLASGDLVDVYGIVPDRSGPVITSASMTVVAQSATVMELSDSAATLAVAAGEVAATVEGTASGTLRIVITG
ncbi:MAG: SAF domain-containing protein [Microthrixaceae bacterium]